MRRTKAQRGKRTYSFISDDADKNNNHTKTTVNPKGYTATNKDNFPHPQVGKGVPKYGSQSETTIDSCP